MPHKNFTQLFWPSSDNAARRYLCLTELSEGVGAHDLSLKFKEIERFEKTAALVERIKKAISRIREKGEKV